jgi:hypothetical protein
MTPQAKAGAIRLRAWGQNAESLIDLLLDPLRKLPIGQAPKIEQTKRIRVQAFVSSSASVVPRLVQNPLSGDAVSSSHGDTDIGDKSDGLSQLQITARPELPPKQPEIFVSYAWGDDSSDGAHQRTEVVDRLCERLERDGWNILRDKTDMRSGELISGFMKRIGLADHVIVVLSDKYLRSPYCMTELHTIYQGSVGEKEDFLRRIIPLVLADARFKDFQDRDTYEEHWTTVFKTMDQSLTKLATEQKLSRVAVDDFRRYKAMQKWYLDVGDMLAYVNDVLTPHGFDEIVKDDFAALRQMLARRS